MASKQILIVEDEESLRRVLKDSFTREGFDVIVAEDAQKGIEAVDKNSPSAVVLDLLLPNGSGYDVLKHIRTDERTKDLPVFVATNVDSSESVLECVSHGVRDYFVKSDTSIDQIVTFVKKKVQSA